MRAELMATIDDEGASTGSGGSLETIIHHEGSALARSASQSSLASASAHSQDQGPDGTTEMVCVEEGIQAPLKEQAVLGATRQIYSPFSLRDDVGVLGVLSGHWGAASGDCRIRWT